MHEHGVTIREDLSVLLGIGGEAQLVILAVGGEQVGRILRCIS